MHRSSIISAALIVLGSLATYAAVVGVFHLAYALGWYAGAPA